MHILKFTQTTEPPETLFCYETLGWNDNGYPSAQYFTIEETLGFRSIVPQGISEILYETIGFNDAYLNSYDLYLYETIGFNDGGDESLVVYIFETIGFNEDGDGDLDYLSLYCPETIGFGDPGYNYIYDEHDITFTWKTRTNADPLYGYGATGYGLNTGYGDGNASNLVSFEIHIWKIDGPSTNRYLDNGLDTGGVEYDDRLTVQTITITDTNDPDADASYTLTVANNKSYNGGDFLYNMEVEIFVEDDNGVYSFPAVIVLDDWVVLHE